MYHLNFFNQKGYSPLDHNKSWESVTPKEGDSVPVFAVIQTQVHPHLAEKIASHPHLKVKEGVWLIESSGTAEDVSGQLDITEGQAGSAIILKVSSYYGRTVANTWDWISTHWE